MTRRQATTSRVLRMALAVSLAVVLLLTSDSGSVVRAQDASNAASEQPGTVAPGSETPAATTATPSTTPSPAPSTTATPSTAPTEAPTTTPAPVATTAVPATTESPAPTTAAPTAATTPVPTPSATPAAVTGAPATAANVTDNSAAVVTPSPMPVTPVPTPAPTPSPESPPPPTEPPTTTTPTPSPTPSPTTSPTPPPVSVSPPPPADPVTTVMPTPAPAATETPAPTTTTVPPAATTAPPTATPTPAPESPPPPTQPANAVTKTPATTAPTTTTSAPTPAPKTLEPTPSPEKIPKEESSTAPSPRVTSAFSPATSNDDNAKVTTPDLSTLDPIIEGENASGANGSSSKKKNSDSSSSTILNDTKSGTAGTSSIGGVNLVLLVVGIIGGVVASLFFVRTRRRNGALRAKRGSSQQRALDAFFEQNASTRGAATSGADRANSSMLQHQAANGNPSSVYSNGSSGVIRDPLTPANEIALASFISRSTGRTTGSKAAGASAVAASNAAASSSGGQRGRFDDSVLRGTAAFQMTGPLPPSPSDSDLESARSSNSRIGISFVSDASSDLSLNPSESSNNGYGGFYQSEIGDFRSTGGVPSMISSETSSMHRSDSNFSGYTKSSFASTTAGDFQHQTDDYRFSSGVYSVGPLSMTRTSSAPSLAAAGSHRNLLRTNSHESIGSSNGSSSEEEYDESAFSSLIISKNADGSALEDGMWRVSELSEGDI